MPRDLIKVEGLKEIEATLKALPARVAKREAGRALAPAARYLRNAVKRNAPVGAEHSVNGSKQYGSLRRNIKSGSVKQKSRRFFASYRVHTGDAFWGLFIEYGTERGIKPNPFFARAFYSSQREMLRIMTAQLKKRLPEAVKAVRKGGK